MRLPDRQRSYAVLIGSGKYADDKLPNLPAVRKTLGDLTAALTDPFYGVVPRDHCTVLENQGDIRLIGQMEVDGTYVLASAERDQVALILPGEDYTAFTGRLLDLLRNGVPGGPELLTATRTTGEPWWSSGGSSWPSPGSTTAVIGRSEPGRAGENSLWA